MKKVRDEAAKETCLRGVVAQEQTAAKGSLFLTGTSWRRGHWPGADESDPGRKLPLAEEGKKKRNSQGHVMSKSRDHIRLDLFLFFGRGKIETHHHMNKVQLAMWRINNSMLAPDGCH